MKSLSTIYICVCMCVRTGTCVRGNMLLCLCLSPDIAGLPMPVYLCARSVGIFSCIIVEILKFK